jgi:hypothetical protein
MPMFKVMVFLTRRPDFLDRERMRFVAVEERPSLVRSD